LVHGPLPNPIEFGLSTSSTRVFACNWSGSVAFQRASKHSELAWAGGHLDWRHADSGRSLEMKVLVVGSSGFVGSNLNLSTPGTQYIGLDIVDSKIAPNSFYAHHKKLDFLSQDTFAFVQELKPEFIILLAGIQFTSPIQKRRMRQAAFSQNVLIARQATEILQRIPTIKKLIYVSTDMVYGVHSKEMIGEDSQPRPIGEYGKSKLEAEEILQKFDSKVAILRPRLIVGPGRAGTIKLLAKFVHGNMPIPLIGKGDNRYQMLSVFDLWSAINKCLETEIHGVFNLGSNSPPTLNELFPKVLEGLGVKKLIIRLPKKLTENTLLVLDKFNLSPLAPEQFLIAGVNCQLSTEKFVKATSWQPVFTDEDIITKSLLELGDRK
jgi:dTDP-glucose 4,6-dehydratase